jgi:hypothetical protein
MLSNAEEYLEEREGGKLLIFQRSGIFQARIYRGKGSRGYIYKACKRAISKKRVKPQRSSSTALSSEPSMAYRSLRTPCRR